MNFTDELALIHERNLRRLDSVGFNYTSSSGQIVWNLCCRCCCCCWLESHLKWQRHPDWAQPHASGVHHEITGRLFPLSLILLSFSTSNEFVHSLTYSFIRFRFRLNCSPFTHFSPLARHRHRPSHRQYQHLIWCHLRRFPDSGRADYQHHHHEIYPSVRPFHQSRTSANRKLSHILSHLQWHAKDDPHEHTQMVQLFTEAGGEKDDGGWREIAIKLTPPPCRRRSYHEDRICIFIWKTGWKSLPPQKQTSMKQTTTTTTERNLCNEIVLLVFWIYPENNANHHT